MRAGSLRPPLRLDGLAAVLDPTERLTRLSRSLEVVLAEGVERRRLLVTESISTGHDAAQRGELATVSMRSVAAGGRSRTASPSFGPSLLHLR